MRSRAASGEFNPRARTRRSRGEGRRQDGDVQRQVKQPAAARLVRLRLRDATVVGALYQLDVKCPVVGVVAVIVMVMIGTRVVFFGVPLVHGLDRKLTGPIDVQHHPPVNAQARGGEHRHAEQEGDQAECDAR